jgi:hypothetical protein
LFLAKHVVVQFTTNGKWYSPSHCKAERWLMVSTIQTQGCFPFLRKYMVPSEKTSCISDIPSFWILVYWPLTKWDVTSGELT